MSFKARFKKAAIATMKKNIEKALGDFREQQEQALQIHGDLIATEAKVQLERKDLDPGGKIAESIKVETRSTERGAEMGVIVTDQAAYEKEVGPEGGFLMVAAELTKGEAERKMAEHLRRELAGG